MNIDGILQYLVIFRPIFTFMKIQDVILTSWTFTDFGEFREFLWIILRAILT